MPYIDRRIRSKISRLPGISVHVTEDCQGCGTCVDACFVKNIRLENGHSVIGDDCMGCGNCVEICPNDAIVMVNGAGRHIDEVIQRLEKIVSVQ